MRVKPGDLAALLAAGATVGKGVRVPPDGAAPTPSPARPGRMPKLVPPSSAWAVTLTIPLVVKSAANAREHHMARHRRVKAERFAVAAAFSCANMPTAPAFGMAVVKLTRLGGRRWDDDNNVSGLKATRDETARWLGVDDGDSRVAFGYDQEPGGPRGVRVEIQAREG